MVRFCPALMDGLEGLLLVFGRMQAKTRIELGWFSGFFFGRGGFGRGGAREGKVVVDWGWGFMGSWLGCWWLEGVDGEEKV